MKKIMKRVSIILVLVMVFSLIPLGDPPTFAVSDASTIDVSDTTNSILPTGVTYASNKFTIGTGANNVTITVIGTTVTNTIEVATGVTGLTLILNGVSITSTAASPINLLGNANITVQLADGEDNTLDASGASGKAGISTNGTATITITGTTGSLTVAGGTNGAGIGGGTNAAGGTITISGGTVDATSGSNYGAGIGGGVNGAGGTITISGGTVTAKAKTNGAGIGAGISSGSVGTVTISGGTVTTSGGTMGAGIGGGCYSVSGGTITISGGTVTATAGSTADTAIGSGATPVDTITIGASAVVMAVSHLEKSAIYAKNGSSGSIINAKLSSVISATNPTYLKCNTNVVKLPATFSCFAFSAAAASSVAAYSDQACTTKLYNIVTNPGGATAIPVNGVIYDPPTSVKTAVALSGTVGLTVNQSTGQVTASATGGNIDTAGTLTYTWTGGATGTGQVVTPILGEEATCTVTASVISGSIEAAATVYKVTVAPSGNTGTDDVSITDAYGEVGDSVSIDYALDGTGTLSNTLTYSGAATTPTAVSTAVSTPTTGTSLYTIDSGDATSGSIALTATFVHTDEVIPDPDDSGEHHSGADVPINAEASNLGESENTVIDGRTITTLTIDAQKLEQMLAAQGDKPVLTIPLKTNSEIQICAFDGQMLSNMETRQVVLEIKTEQATYTLPAREIDLEAILAQFGPGVDLKDIQVTIEIAKASESVALLVENAAKEGEFSIVAPPVEFNLKCTYGDKTIAVTKFESFVERTVAIPDGVDPSKITTGIVVDPDGTVCHVPTEIIVIDGKYFARINSLTNSIYSVIWNPITFSDVENHWAKEAVNDMGSRMVISGIGGGLFEPERQMTRAEFAAVIVRALGLKPGNGNNKFTDIKSTDWYLPYVETASEYGIISGYDNAHFGPMDLITREQAMTMVARTMKITGLDVKFDANEAEKLLAAFEDGRMSSLWAKDSMAACIKAAIVSGKGESLLAPKDNITRAEVTVIVRRLLQKSSLI